MSFIDIPNTTQEIRGAIYDIFATYNIILHDKRRQPMLEKIREENNHLEIPDLDDKEFKSKLSSLFEKEWNVSLEEVIKKCNEDGIFSEITNHLK
ncbi:hypothetical protein [Peribacillus sp. CSMR9]|uniref:hypothetical protein n=1 Tax=Peribacillus sp. CSMR9 TaxID=2981350 RepID=UPI0029559666|nr:hypothetical protein [Peribacillus sp. CSMR9]MDV7766518.1 hypothetical protein [Peribacillus sp. CSMR9]